MGAIEKGYVSFNTEYKNSRTYISVKLESNIPDLTVAREGKIYLVVRYEEIGNYNTNKAEKKKVDIKSNDL